MELIQCSSTLSLFQVQKVLFKASDAYREDVSFMFFSLAAKNEADRQAEKREIKRRLTRKVLLAPVL